MRRKKPVTIVALLAVVACVVIARALISTPYVIHSTATIQAIDVEIGVYEDINCTVSVTSIDWGILQPGEWKNYSAYVRNEGTVPILLSMSTENWTPTNASDWIALTWDIGGQTLAVDEVIPVTFLLLINSEISGITTFSFDILIRAAG